MNLLFSVVTTVQNCSPGTGNSASAGCVTNFPIVSAGNTTLQSALQVIFGIIGALTVIYLMYSAIRLTLSQGDPQTIARERQAIIFAIVGLIVALSAELIVTFVLGRV